MQNWSKIEQDISLSLGEDFRLDSRFNIAVSSVNQSLRIEGLLAQKPISFFIKFNRPSSLVMFEAEAAGLKEIEKTQTIRVPRVICYGANDEQSYLVTENLSFETGSGGSAAQLGQKLANMHQFNSAHAKGASQTSAKQFGWHRDNTIGLTPQINTQTDNWIEFWREHRLAYQLKLAKDNGAGKSLLMNGDKLLLELDRFFTGYQPQASLLHGDLWSGNYGYIGKGEPVIFDPAVYYGDRETDLAMTELFGGFPQGFYVAYNKVWPLDEGYQKRKKLYNLYHVLNHFNLFAGGYETQAEHIMEQLLQM